VCRLLLFVRLLWTRRVRRPLALGSRNLSWNVASQAAGADVSVPPHMQIMNLALLVVSYGVSHRLFEFAWKGQLRALYPTPAAYQARRVLASCFLRRLLLMCAALVLSSCFCLFQRSPVTATRALSAVCAGRRVYSHRLVHHCPHAAGQVCVPA
jgi:hypothetical protein